MRRLIAILALVLIAACGGRWHHPTKSDADFERDRAECKLLAKHAAKAQTMTGKRVDLEIYYKTLSSCLYAKGWSDAAPAAEAGEPSSTVPLTQKEGAGTFKFAGQVLHLPEGSAVVKESVSSYGPVRMQVIDFTGKKGGLAYQGQVVFQRSYAEGFEAVDYPVGEPFFTYTRGSIANGVRWNSYSVKLDNGVWIGGVGAYWLISKEERVVISLVRVLPPQKAAPPPNCRLSQVQGRAMDRFVDFALPWLDALGEKKRSWLPFLKWRDYKFLIDF